MSRTVLTAESVTEGHPDKLCDLISDSVLDACLSVDAYSRVACEVLATKGQIYVAGEITCKEEIDIYAIVKETLAKVGYNPDEFKIAAHIHVQSSDIAGGVDNSLENRMGESDDNNLIGAGDQGIMYGYATDETPEYLPMPVVLAHKLTKKLTQVRKAGEIPVLRPDGKSQVSVEYVDGKPTRITAVIISTQHTEDTDMDQLRCDILEKVLKPALCSGLQPDENTDILLNPAGRFVLGGPEADTGLTGRKLMVDTYGGLASHGGGAFSGKDCTKVDRSGAYMARYMAKNVVAAGLANKCEISLSYAIGKAHPVAVSVNTFGTGKVSDEAILEALHATFDMRPEAIIKTLDLRKPGFAKTAAYGHFGRERFSWERTDKAENLRKLVNL